MYIVHLKNAVLYKFEHFTQQANLSIYTLVNNDFVYFSADKIFFLDIWQDMSAMENKVEGLQRETLGVVRVLIIDPQAYQERVNYGKSWLCHICITIV